MGVAIGGDQSTVSSGAYGAAIGGKRAHASAGALALVYNGGTAVVSDGGVAICREAGETAEATNGVAYSDLSGAVTAGANGCAITRRSRASAGKGGLASVREGGEVQTGPRGIAIAWNQPLTVTTDGAIVHEDGVSFENGVLSVGEGGVLVAYLLGSNGVRQPVVGLTEGDPSMNVPYLVQFGLTPKARYQLNHGIGLFERITD